MINVKRSRKGKRRTLDHGPTILDKLELVAIQQPCADKFMLEDEATAKELLLALAALLSNWIHDPSVRNDPEGLENLRRHAGEYRHAAITGTCLKYISELSEDDQIEIAGLLILAKPPTIQ